MFKSFSLVLLTALLYTGVSAQAPVAGISSAQTSRCLQVRNSKFADGTVVDTGHCNDGANQQWEIYNGLTEVVLNQGSSTKYCLDAKDIDNASPVVLWECNQKPWQQWIYDDDGLLTLANNTNLCLEIPNTNNGVQVRTSPCNGALSQVWNLV